MEKKNHFRDGFKLKLIITEQLRFVVKDIMNVALLKKRAIHKKKKKKLTTFFTIVDLTNFY